VSAGMRLDVELQCIRRTLIVRLKGELDHHTADSVRLRMEEAIEQEDIHDVIVSLKQLTFMDSSGLGVMIGRYKQITAKGGKMIVCDVNPAVHRLFEMSGLFKIVTLLDNEEVALSSLGVVS